VLPHSATKLLLAGSEQKRKVYRCLVQLDAPATQQAIDALAMRRDIAVTQVSTHRLVLVTDVAQLTPFRVAHRRASLVRTKTVHRVGVRHLRALWYAVTLTTSAGTYVKEFVHGDLGRTRPSLAALLGVQSAQLALLDVLDVGLRFPPGDETLNADVSPPPTVPRFGPLVMRSIHDELDEE
jgi:tRNA pseudouridine synthase 10